MDFAQEDFAEKLALTRDRTAELGAAPLASGLLQQMQQELSTSLEELQVAEEEMRAQNDALAQALGRLEVERQRYLDLFEWAPDGYLVTDLHGTIREANQAAARLLSVAARYLTGKPLASYIAPEETRAFRGRLSEAGTAGVQNWEGQEWEITLRPRHGEPFPAALTVGVTRDSQGCPLNLRWLARDISARKQAEAAREKLQADLLRERHITESLQRSLLPDTSEDQFPALSVATFYETALDEAKVGGDFYDVFTVDGGKIALVVGDVSGKGLSAAARTAEIKYTLRAFLRETERPDRALADLNGYLCDARNRHDWEEDLFVVLSLAVIDPASGVAEMCVAGAEPILMLHPHDSPEAVETRGLLVGIAPGAVYTQIERRLTPGETLLMATNGITEARRGTQHFLGIEGLKALAYEAQERHTLHGLGEAILEGARAFAGGSLHDDACVLLAHLNYRGI